MQVASYPLRNSGELRGRVLSRGKFGVFVALRPPDGPLDGSETVGLLHKKADPRSLWTYGQTANHISNFSMFFMVFAMTSLKMFQAPAS